ncbi:MAG: GNAT family N-acetyltransferase [Gemmatimonadetes bacterium]|nr:GNAT family N-acetyltransferase [Gemmatimonadota bacterium]MDA1103444.1 GNAT family N-acetyltransferase [Gemmatimonadota bacterium]
MTTVVRHASPTGFLARAESWLLRAEDQHNVLLGLAYVKAVEPSPDDDVFYATVEQGGAVVGAAIRTPPRKVMITELPPDAGRPLAAALAEVYDRIPGILGSATSATLLAEAWAELRSCSWRPGLKQRLYRLGRVVPPPIVPGRLRAAEEADIDLAVEWGVAFARDAGAQFVTDRASVTRWVASGALHLWDVDGVPMSIAVAQGRTPRGGRIGYVYTPREQRGQGYASACVAALCQKLLDGGLEFCVLYTDLSNPTSNELYQRLGFVPLADVRDVDILDEADT